MWIYTTRYVDFVNTYHRQAAGVKGLVYVPNARRKGDDGLTLDQNSSTLRDDAGRLGARLIVGLEYEEQLRLANVADLARADIYTIYAIQLLRSNPQGYRHYLERIVRAARAVNPAIQIEVAISTGATPEATRAMAGVIWENADLVDRIGIFCNDTAPSTASVEAYFRAFRGLPTARVAP